jgi:hypothetical protein
MARLDRLNTVFARLSLLPFFLRRQAPDNFAFLRMRSGLIRALFSVVGVYFCPAGNGLHGDLRLHGLRSALVVPLYAALVDE